MKLIIPGERKECSARLHVTIDQPLDEIKLLGNVKVHRRSMLSDWVNGFDRDLMMSITGEYFRYNHHSKDDE